jgi:hypothetical protein
MTPGRPLDPSPELRSPMSAQNTDDDQQRSEDGDVTEAEQYGSLSVEDDPEGTIHPSELAGTATEDDEDVS